MSGFPISAVDSHIIEYHDSQGTNLGDARHEPASIRFVGLSLFMSHRLRASDTKLEARFVRRDIRIRSLRRLLAMIGNSPSAWVSPKEDSIITLTTTCIVERQVVNLIIVVERFELLSCRVFASLRFVSKSAKRSGDFFFLSLS